MTENLEEKTEEKNFEIETFQFGEEKRDNSFFRRISDAYRNLCDNISYYTGW